MGEDEPVKADKRRELDCRIFCHPVGDIMEIGGFLVVLCVELEPAGVPQGDRVLLVVPDGERCPERTVGNRHDNGQAHAGSVEADLEHQGKALRGGCGIGTGSRSACPEAGGERGEFIFDRDIVRVEFPVCHHLGERLDDMCLGRDRVGGNNLRAAEPDRFGDGIEPSVISSILLLLLFHRDRFLRALFCTEPASLAVCIIRIEESLLVLT